MKISPIATGGQPGADLTANIGRTASPEKLALAKAIAAGEAQIKVTPSENNVDPQVEKAKNSIRSIKMKTNVSPDRFTGKEVPVEAKENDKIDETVKTEEATEETKPISPQLAELARARRALQVKERELADREKALEAKVPTNNDDLVARLKSKPLSVLQEHGVTYDQLTEAIIADQSGINPLIQEMKAEIKALKEGVDKNFIDRDTQAEQQVLAEMQKEAVLLAKQGDEFEMVRETRSIPDVMKLIHRTYKETGEVLEVQEALKLVEEELINKSLKIANINKVKNKISPPAEVTEQPQRIIRTLTNRDSAPTGLTRRERAIMAAQGLLKG